MNDVTRAGPDAFTTVLPTSSTRAGVHRGRLFRKYLLLILTLVTIALLASGAISIYFTYQETKSSLASLQHEKAIAAASRIEQYVNQIEQQLAYAALQQLDPGDVELRRVEFLKLLRQAPEVTDVAQLDAAGHERIAVSRLGMDRLDSGRDRSHEPAFREAKPGQPWFGPVYFRKETEPYMTIALRAKGERGTFTMADVNLKFIWDVVSRIRIGDKGKAYVVDGNGFLVADPDIGLVLRKTNLSALPHVKAAALALGQDVDPAMVSSDLNGKRVLASVAPIESLNWNVFVEQPVSEVYAKLNASILRAALLLLAGLALSALGALALARGMVRPIRTLEEGAQRIGAGDLDQRIEVHTGDELEALAAQFNRMSGQLRESYAGLEQKVTARTHELANALEQQTAITEILRVISSSPTDVKPVLDAVAERAARLCEATVASVLLRKDDALRPMSAYSADGGAAPTYDYVIPLRRTMITGRAVLDRSTVATADVVPLLDDEFPDARENQQLLGFRAVLAVPLLREDIAYGAIYLYRREPRAFSGEQVALVETFASQAAIAIDNVRLFNETKDALEQQTAISEILRVIPSSPADVQPVLDAIAERAARLCGASAASIYLLEGDTLRHLASRGPSPDPVSHVDTLPLDRSSISGRAFVDRRAIQVNDMLAEGRDYPLSHALASKFDHRTVLVIPLFREGEPFGTILLRRREVRPFGERERALLQTFGDQAAIALENVRLFNETKEALDQQRASGEVLTAISNSIADTAPVFRTILAGCERLFAGNVIAIERVTDAGTITIAAYRGPPGSFDQTEVGPVQAGASISANAIVSRSVQHYADLAGAEGVPARSRDGYADVGVRAVMVAPMVWEGRGIGVISVGHDHPGPFSDKEIGLLKTFADQAAIAIQNARLFREIEEKSRQLEIANKHKSEFLANMSHELRTPLNAIIGFSEVLLERLFGDLNDKQDDYLKDIHSSGKHLLSLINDILDLSKIEAGRMELEPSRFEVATAVSNALTLVRERAQQHRITVAQDVDPSLGEIEADERKFKQILLNLLSNAVKFTPDGGRIEIRARRNGECAEFAVRDSGIGIAPEDQATVFEEFRQVGRDYTKKHEGTGLGLALTRKFVELHGGRIRLESTPGAGSTFTFTIPLAP